MPEPIINTGLIAGAKLEYSIDDGTTWIILEGVREFPDFREEQGEREVTTVRNKVRQYDNEMDSPTEQDLTAFYLIDDADQYAFRQLAINKSACLIKATYDDADSLEFGVKLKNYGINGGAAEADKMWSCTMRRTTVITYTEAAPTP